MGSASRRTAIRLVFLLLLGVALTQATGCAVVAWTVGSFWTHHE